MEVYVVIETCCNHFIGFFTDKTIAEEVATEGGYYINTYTV
jgi:hypothetical protein